MFKGFFKVKKNVETTEVDDEGVNGREQDGTDVDAFRYYNSRDVSSGSNKKKRVLSQTTLLDGHIHKWRGVSTIPEVQEVLEDTVNTILSTENLKSNILDIDFDEASDKTLNKAGREKISDSYYRILNMINFEDEGYNIVWDFIVDGRLQAEMIYKEDKVTEGIQKIKLMSPFNLVKSEDEDGTLTYTYTDSIQRRHSMYGRSVHVYKDEQFVQVESSDIDPNTGLRVSILNNAIKASNNLTNIEDSMVLVRFMKGIKMRIWNVNVGRLSATKSKAFLKEVEGVVNQDLKYNNKTGEFESKKKMGSLFQDFIFPVRNSNDITQVDTVDGDTALLEGDDHQLFLKKLYKSLHQPVSRLSDTPTIEYDSMDIIKDEETFIRYTSRLRIKIKQFLLEMVKRDCIARGELTQETWEEIYPLIRLRWSEASNIILRVKMEIWQKKAETLSDLKDSGIAGNVLSYDYIYKNILDLTETEIKEQQEAIKLEKKSNPALYKKEEDD